jgi:hypothetical protein
VDSQNFHPYWMPIPAGVTTVQFRGNRWHVRDIAIWAAGAVRSPSATKSPSASPSPTPTATPNPSTTTGVCGRMGTICLIPSAN